VTVETRVCATPADVARSLEIYNAVFPRRRTTPEQVVAWKRASLASVEFLVSIDGEDVGSGAAGLPDTQPDVCIALVTVLAEHRGSGAGTALYEAISRWAAEQGRDTLESRAEGDDDESLAFARRRGFTESWRETGFELDPRSAAPDLMPLAGIEIVRLADRPELAEAIYDVAVEAMPDIPSLEDWRAPERERFLDTNVRSPSSVLVLALEGGDVVGYASLAVRDDEAVHAMTAVKRAWRGRGIARALKAAEIAWAKEHGLARLTATNELRSAAMIRVNESLGYRPAPGRVGLRGPLAAPVPSPRT
jgi:GNAT superfamily N-acetyltransferase